MSMVSVSVDSQKVLAVTSTGNLGFLDVSSREYSTLMRSHTDTVLGFSVDGIRRHLTTASADGTLRIWNMDSLHQVTTNTDLSTSELFLSCTHFWYFYWKLPVVKQFSFFDHLSGNLKVSAPFFLSFCCFSELPLQSHSNILLKETSNPSTIIVLSKIPSAI